jgi:hypothetical protein
MTTKNKLFLECKIAPKKYDRNCNDILFNYDSMNQFNSK